LGCTPDTAGELQCSPDPLAAFKGPVSKGRKEKGEKMGREGRTEGGAVNSVKLGPAR